MEKIYEVRTISGRTVRSTPDWFEAKDELYSIGEGIIAEMENGEEIDCTAYDDIFPGDYYIPDCNQIFIGEYFNDGGLAYGKLYDLEEDGSLTLVDDSYAFTRRELKSFVRE